MEAASWLAGEKWSDHPRSVHRAIASVARWVNDAVDDDQRQTLWPLILESLDTGRRLGLRLDRRLRKLTREAGCRAASRGSPIEAWVEVISQYRRSTSLIAPQLTESPVAELVQKIDTRPQREAAGSL